MDINVGDRFIFDKRDVYEIKSLGEHSCRLWSFERRSMITKDYSISHFSSGFWEKCIPCTPLRTMKKHKLI